MSKLEQEYAADDLERIKLNYGLVVLKNELVKLVIMGLFYLVIGKFLLFLFATVILLPVRAFSGGLHMKGNISCFLFSFCFFYLAVVLLPGVSLSAVILFIILACTSVSLMICAPVDSPQKPILSKARYNSFKIKCCVLTVLTDGILTGLYLFGYKNLAAIGIWIIALQSIQLLTAKILRKGMVKQCIKNS